MTSTLTETRRRHGAAVALGHDARAQDRDRPRDAARARVELRVPLRTPGGKARLTVVYTDAAGLKKTIARTVTVPRKTLT